MKPISPADRRALRAKAHHLEPVVIVGQHGLTPAVLHEIDLALLAHDLVKVRVLGDDREVREGMLGQACEALDCAAVQHVGKILVLWRPNPERNQKASAPAKKPAKPGKKRPKVMARTRTAQRGPVDPVRERRRGAAGSPATDARRRGAPAPAATDARRDGMPAPAATDSRRGGKPAATDARRGGKPAATDARRGGKPAPASTDSRRGGAAGSPATDPRRRVPGPAATDARRRGAPATGSRRRATSK